MKGIFAKSSFKTPEIIFDPGNNIFTIKGRSLPEDAKSFYAPYKKWLAEYLTRQVDQIAFVFEIYYFNTSSSKMILDMLYLLRDAKKKGKHIDIIWRYEQDDEEMLEAGEDYEAIIKTPISFEESLSGTMN